MTAPELQAHLKQNHWIKMLSFFGILAAIFAALLVIENLLLSFVVSVVISFFVSPIVSYLEGTGLSRLISILIVYCFFTTLTGLTIWAVTPFFLSQMAALKTQLPAYVDGTVRLFDGIAKSLDAGSGGIIHVDISDHLREWLTSQSSALVSGLPRVLSSSFSVLFLSPLLGFFILKDGRTFARELLALVPNNIFELVLSLQYQILEQIAQYIRARILESLILGVVCLLGFWIIGFPYAMLLAAFAAIANLIPYVGPLFGAAPGIIFVFINQGSWVEISLVLAVYTVAQVIDNLLIIPLLVARIVNLHPLTVILSVLLGAQLLGILGMLISIPVASTIKVTAQSIYNHLTDYAA